MHYSENYIDGRLTHLSIMTVWKKVTYILKDITSNMNSSWWFYSKLKTWALYQAHGSGQKKNVIHIRSHIFEYIGNFFSNCHYWEACSTSINIIFRVMHSRLKLELDFFFFFWPGQPLAIHSSEIRGLCSTKCSSETLQNGPGLCRHRPGHS